jgi:hypothetical protein
MRMKFLSQAAQTARLPAAEVKPFCAAAGDEIFGPRCCKNLRLR